MGRRGLGLPTILHSQYALYTLGRNIPPCHLGISRWKGIKLLSDFPLYGEVLIVRSPDFMASVTTLIKGVRLAKSCS